MAEPDFRSHYFDDRTARELFIRFVAGIHGLDLSQWDREGYWDSDYVPFSFFLEGQLIASTCLYLLPMTVQGEPKRVAQVSSVGTLPKFRRRGLNRELTKRAMEWARDNDIAFTFLFADDDAVPFYHACGFRPAPQHRFTLAAEPVASPATSVSLDTDKPDDRQLIERLSRERTPVSQQLGHQSFGLQMFHVLYTLGDQLRYLPDLDLIVAATQREDTLVLHDLIATNLPSFSDLQPHLPAPGISRYEFEFIPDCLKIDPTVVADDQDHGTHVDAPFPFLDSPFHIPYSAHA